LTSSQKLKKFLFPEPLISMPPSLSYIISDRSESSDLDNRFSNYLNKKYSDSWKVKSCDFHSEGSEKSASCLFKRIM